jgi:hypothetical protein
MPESLQQLLVTNFGLSPSGYTGSEGAVGYVGSGGTNGYTGSAGASGSAILISNIQVTNSSYTVLDDTAVDTAGGYIKISGSGFVSGCSVLINQTAATSVTFISSTEVRAQLPATTAGTYIVYLVNTSGDVAIRVNGVTFSATPTWVTGSGLSGSVDTALSIQLSASSATTYALQAGSSLPAGVTLSNVGLISGTVSGLSSNTVYNFTIVATDAELQDSPRSFALTITVGDPYFRYTTLLIPGASTTFLADASTNNFALTTAGSPKPSLRSPFAGTGGSTEFATGDSLTTPVSADFVVGSSDAFCLEFWVYYTSAPSGYTFMCSIPGTTNSQYLNIRTGDAGFSSKIQAELGSGFSGLLDNSSYTTSYLVNKWTHIALCRTGGVTSFFIDGTRVATRTGDTITLSGNNYFAVNSTYGSQYSFPGYMSNVRWVKGSAVYDPSSSTITVPTAPLTAVANTKLLILQSSQPVSNNVFLDSSVNNFAITRNGNTTQGTFSPYGENWSNYFDGSGDYLAATSPSMSGTWTVELWWFPTVSATQQTIVAFNQGSAGTLAINIWMNTSNQLVVDNGQVASGLFTSGTFTINAWNHVAVVRNGTTTTGYINGAVVGTNTFTPGAVNNVNVGRYPDGNLTTFYYMSGYISNLRVVTGTAVYTSAFTPSTTPLTAISGTSLLTCQSNRFIDNSTNNYAVTKFGDVSVQRFSPFSPSASYDAGTFGGSAYFDGNGDYLTTNYTMNWSTYGSYTLEFWVYHTTMSPANQWYFTGGSGGTGNTIFYNYSNGRVGVGINGTNEIVSSAGVIKANTWQHIAYTFNGTTTIVYVDGVQVASGTTAIYANSSITLAIGGGSTSSSISVNGYIANMRLSRSVIYSSAFTPPTAPVTAIASTNLLCNFTGGAIVDNTMLSNLETIGSAQISTTQSKFGGGSMYFNGSSTCTILASPNLNFGTGDFTIEMWVYSASQSSGGNRTMGNGAGASWGANKWIFTTTTPGNLNKFTWHFWNHNSGSSDLLVSSSASNNSTWTYVAITRSGNTFRMFVNGVIEATSTSSASVDGNIPVQLTLGNSGVAGDSSWTGYIDDLRITKGYARYTANFTPTTTAFLRQ